MIPAELLTREEWAALVDQAVMAGLPGAAEAQFQLLLADAVVEESLPHSATEQYARENPASFAHAMGDDYLASVLEGKPIPAYVAERIFHPPELSAERLPEVSLPFDLEPTIEEEKPMEVIDENTTEGRAQRYIERKQGARPAAPRGQRIRPSLRVWDQPEDLVFQDVGLEQPEHESGPLQQNDGSITTTQR